MENISKATLKNWEKLKVDEKNKKLEHRANKTMSKKIIIPKELFKNRKNEKSIKSYIEYIKEHIDNLNVEKVMRSFCIKWLIQNELLDLNFQTNKKNIKKFVLENKDFYNEILEFELPADEENILGIIYQCFQNEGDKNRQGSYYTPNSIVNNMVSQMDVTLDTKILDPCCGTGIFLTKSNLKNPENLWGVDIDAIAVMIAKVNLFIKYKNLDFEPNLFTADYLENTDNILGNELFDYIITNPPWGADVSYISSALYREVRSRESFSYMIVKSKNYLKIDGELIFLLPESFLNVKIHNDIREFLLKRMVFEKITLYPSSFSGVLTKFISVRAKKRELETYNFETEDLGTQTIYTTGKKEIEENENFAIPILSFKDKDILKKVFKPGYNTLKDSIWALGIVTGDNLGKVKKEPAEGLEPIYTGKEVSEYKLMQPKNYIKYDRLNFQQVAPDRFYRAEEKLVYKFISKNITFAYDNTKSLVLNSANILIPNIEGMSIKTCMAFLNSNLFKYVYIKKFGDIKILKGNLEQMPFPVITKDEDIEISKLCDCVIAGELSKKDEINEKIYKIFDINELDIQYIEKFLKV